MNVVSSLYGVAYITCCAILDEIIVSIYYNLCHAHGLLSLEFSLIVGIESRGIRIVDDNQRPRIYIRAEGIGLVDGVGFAQGAVFDGRAHASAAQGDEAVFRDE